MDGTLRARRLRRLRLEPLEDRRLLTAYVVDSLADAYYASPSAYPADGSVTLREALEAANRNAVVGDAAAGSPVEVDSITFDPAVFGSQVAINLAGRPLEVTDALTVAGPGAELLTIDAQGLSRVLEIGAETWAPLVPMNSTWSYLDEISNGLGGDPVQGYPLDADHDAWNSSEFDTATSDQTIGTWQTGNGVFGDGSLEIGPAATFLDGIDDAMNGSDNAVTTYLFRRTFNVVDAASIGRLRASLFSDDGGVLYINGVEVLSTLMPGGQITTETFATAAGNESQYVDHLIDVDGVLVEGTNTIAYELHQVNHSSSDVGFDLALSALSTFPVSISDLTLTGGNVAADGGGINNINGTVTLANVVLSGNRAANGGGMYNFGEVVSATNSVFVGNWANDDGGGIYNAGTLNVMNSTVAANWAQGVSDACGGGIYNEVGGTLAAANSIVAFNVAPAEANIFGSMAPGSGFNLLGIDPRFVRNPSPGADGTWGTADDDYGDLNLTGVSPVIDLGSDLLVPAGLTADATDNPRIHGQRVDIGAYEFQAELPPGRETPATVVTTSDDTVDLFDGLVSLRESLLYVGLTDLGNVVRFDPTLAGAEIVLGGNSLFVDRNVVIDAGSDESITMNAVNQSRVVYVLSGELELNNVVATGGWAARNGGGILNYGTLFVRNSTISGNSTDALGGGVCSHYGSLAVSGTTLLNNSAAHGGGIYTYGSTVTLVDATISENSATNTGGGLRHDRDALTVNNSSVTGNSSGYGGGIYAYAGTATVTETTIADNTAAYKGGGIRTDGGALTVIDSTISNNWANNDGGGVESDGTFDATNSIIADNSADYGGGVFSYGELTVSNSAITGNSADSFGGGVYGNFGSMTFTNTMVSGNSAEYGGGLRNKEYCTLNVASSIVVGNSASTNGGGIHNYRGVLNVTNSTVAGNSAGGRGGGVYDVSGTATATNSLVSLNEAPTGANIYGAYTNQSSWIGGDPGFIRNPSPSVDGLWGTTDDDFGDLRLRVRSLAVDAGNDALAVDANGSPLVNDIAGNPRFLDGDGDGTPTVDIGAFEYVPEVIGFHLFYRNSSHDDGSGDSAIARDKRPLREGQAATAANYSNFSLGINGLMIDVNKEDDGTVFSADDFVFRVGNDDDPTQWATAPTPMSIETRPGQGAGGSMRVEIDWAILAIRNTWLQVTVLANENTDLLEDEVFYFGNAVGEVGNDPDNALVTAADVIAIRNHPRGEGNRAGIDDPHDVNRDRLVDAIDVLLARNFASGPFTALRLISPPAAVAAAPFEGEGESLAGQKGTVPFSLRCATRKLGQSPRDEASIRSRVGARTYLFARSTELLADLQTRW